MKKLIRFPVLFIILVSFLFCLNSAVKAEQFTELNDFQNWAFNKGYPQGLLVPLGFDGVNQDIFILFPAQTLTHPGKSLSATAGAVSSASIRIEPAAMIMPFLRCGADTMFPEHQRRL
jgi:hypothetical protein